jgi:hypothetical protein
VWLGNFKYWKLLLALLLIASPFISNAQGFDYRLPLIDNTIVFDGDIKYDSLPPVPVWKLNCDGSTNRAIVIDKPDDDKVRSNLALFIFHNDSSYNYTFTYNPNDIIPCKTPSAEWGLKVNNPRYDAKAVITFSDCMGNDTTIMISYTAPKVYIKPDFSSFGIVKKGYIVFRDFWILNLSEDKPAIINKLELKYKNRGFSISEIIVPFTILPLDSVKFKVSFTNNVVGKYIDSIGFGDTCLFFNAAHVEAEVTQPIINVSNAQFEDLPIRKTATQEIEISNTGSADLIITGYKGPNEPVYKAHLPDISVLKPLILKPDSVFSFAVDFKPLLEQQYQDSIVFFSDADIIDSVALLNGNGVQPGMISTSYDWGRKRVGGTYDAGNKCIVIENTSEGDVTIHGIAAKVDNGGDAFIFDRSKFNNLTIPIGDSVIIPVKFEPPKEGVYELVIVYDNTVNSQTETRLYGVGVKPLITSSPINFDTSVVNQYTYPVLDTVKFNIVDWQFGDTLRIYDISILPTGNEISTDYDKFGTEGFKFDKGALKLPAVLLPGQSLEIPIVFVAQKKGTAFAQLRSVSDAGYEAVSNLTGFGINEGIKINPTDSSSICLGDKDTIACSIENLGDKTINIDSIEINHGDNQFIFANQTDRFGFYLDSGRSERVDVIFQPYKPGISNADMVFYTSMINNSIVTNKLTGIGKQAKRKVLINLNQVDNKVKIGESVSGSVILEPGEDIDYINIKSLIVSIRYNGMILKAEPEDIKIGDLLAGRFRINNLTILDNPGIINLTLDTLAGIPNQKLSGQGELVKFTLNAYLPNSRDFSYESIIEPVVGPRGTQCADFSTDDTTTIQLEPICQNDITKIDIGSLNYRMGAINPNPVGPEGCEVSFSIGLEGMTVVDIYSYLGDIVCRIMDSDLKPGVYTFDLPMSKLVSGVYWVNLTSGPFQKIQKFVVTK